MSNFIPDSPKHTEPVPYFDGSTQETLEEHTNPTYLKPNRHDRRRAAALKRKEKKQKGKGK